jgi:K+/H+ antiporter YhaU regulatory subunit KhtT
LEVSQNEKGDQLILEKIQIPPKSNLVGKNLEASGIRDKTGLLVAAYINPEGETTLSPSKDCILDAESTIVVFGTNQSLSKLGEIL